ncbi:MAG: hypothetical protein DIZ80_04090 [endosymbiont of Galathealinum brachiosum]|uniref:PAS domain-containing protein n=1 Tax=endosymbiont of Galathealinum brachiosum TaxID=2200906 RepID=A0A370DK29_9GAMM|nr:MAG: hypothetical protein DIZ80_04090 [endosymbiont of Galathealinum brachiosum]
MSALHELFEHTSDAIFGIDENRNIRFWNKSCENILGLSHRQAVGQSCADLLCGKDLQGNEICNTECPIAKVSNVQAGDNDFELILKSGKSESVLVNVGSYYINELYQKNNCDIQVFHSMRLKNCQQHIQDTCC